MPGAGAPATGLPADVPADMPDGVRADVPAGASRAGSVRRRFLSGCAALALVTAVAACGPATNDEVAGAQPAGAPQPATSDGGGGEADDPSDGDENGEDEEEEAGTGSGQKDRPDVPKPDPDDYPGKDEHTAEGAEQAFRYFVAQMIWSYQTGDTEEYAKLYDKQCDGCARNESDIIEFADKRQYWSETSIEDVLVEHYDSELHELEVGYAFNLSPHSEPILGNKKKEELGLSGYTIIAGLTWRNGWQVGALNVKTHPDGVK